MTHFRTISCAGVYARSLRGLEIGDFTRYMIGWTEELYSKYEPLLMERFSFFK